jgi:hypothetical protein
MATPNDHLDSLMGKKIPFIMPIRSFYLVDEISSKIPTDDQILN